MSGYVRLDSTDVESGDSSDTFAVTVLMKEKSYQITGLTPKTKLLELKEKIKNSTDISVLQQRLIFTGRRLDSDEKTLSDFKITQSCTIHLFPLPNAVPISSGSNINSTNANSGAVPNNSGDQSVYNPLYGNINAPPSDMPNHTPIHFDENVSQASREVKLWSIILIFLCVMTLMDAVSALLAGDKIFNDYPLHDIVVALNIISSMAGLWVGNLGLRSTRSLDISEINKYTKYLRLLGIVCLLMRILWVFDIIHNVQKIVDDSQSTPSSSSTDSGTATGGGSGGSGTSEVPLDQSVVQSATLEASLIAFFCAYAWGSCLFRAWQLHEVVRHYTESTSGGRSLTNAGATPSAPVIV